MNTISFDGQGYVDPIIYYQRNIVFPTELFGDAGDLEKLDDMSPSQDIFRGWTLTYFSGIRGLFAYLNHGDTSLQSLAPRL